ncbi:MAG: PD-(D/E)XK nuclease family protein [Clostridiales bacterium]|nr:PD-(D/E)XK nuclease family protein [Clostridiales bacterium]
MLKIHFGRESLDKEKYMFDAIKGAKGMTLLLVPDQFTLQAEKEAFHYLETKGFMDLEVLSFSRLGARVLKETGGSRKAAVDQCGRRMLITKITAENRGKLKLFRNSSKLASFSQMANDLIYEMKQYNTTPESLLASIEGMPGDSILKQKLTDIHLLYSSYEQCTKGKYLDGEDYLELFTSKINDSKLVRGSSVWVHGFDYFTPKNQELLKEMMKCARETNILLTYDDAGKDSEIFQVTGRMIARMAELAAESGVPWESCPVPAAYAKGRGEKGEALMAVERELFALPTAPQEDCDGSGYEGVTLVRAANPHSEIESAAAFVSELVREHGLAYKDIALICNDMDERARIVKRTFSEYGIDVFVDQKRSLMHNAAVRFVLSLMGAAINGCRTSDIFCMLKSGMTGMPASRYEELENYSVKYKIKGSMWKKEFSKGFDEYGEAFSELEASRKEIAGCLAEFEAAFAKAKTVRQKVEALYFYLSETVKIPEKLESAALEAGSSLFEFAEEAAQTWSSIVGVFDQLVEILGDEELSQREFAEVLKTGLESVEVGLLPPTADGLLLGTMQRMRVGRIRALLVIGANEGVLPAAMAKEGLLSDDEKGWLFEQGVEMCRREELRLDEERIAIYRNMSKPGQFLWMSHSISDNDGGKLGASAIFDKLTEIFPGIEVQKDIISQNDPARLIQSRGSALLHLTGALREAFVYEKQLAEEWKCAASWYRKNESRRYRLMADGLFYKNSQGSLPFEVVEGLYKHDKDAMTISPSRLEKYGRCPFSFFMDYGLAPEEIRVFEIAGREIGDVYHNCIMRFSKELTERGKKITSPGSRWMVLSREESDDLVGRLIDDEASTYREGMFSQGSEEAYRTDRIKAVCRENAWILVQHVRCGNIKSMYFETRFGGPDSHKGGSMPAVAVSLSGGKQVLIEGKIDRVDTLADGSVKIIDYKSGKEKFSIAEAKAGWRLQLMLYLKAAQRQEAEPAGVFYYTIDEYAQTGRMDGVVVGKPSVIDSIAGDFQDYSGIIPVRRLKDGKTKGNSEWNLLSEAEFAELQAAVDDKVKALCEELLGGCIGVRPKRSGDMTACTYCGYRGVCNFDVDFDGFKYENI